MREGLGGSDGQMRVGVKGREEQDDRSRVHDDCGMICVIVSCCVMCMIHGLCCRWLGDGMGRQHSGDGGAEGK